MYVYISIDCLGYYRYRYWYFHVTGFTYLYK